MFVLLLLGILSIANKRSILFIIYCFFFCLKSTSPTPHRYRNLCFLYCYNKLSSLCLWFYLESFGIITFTYKYLVEYFFSKVFLNNSFYLLYVWSDVCHLVLYFPIVTFSPTQMALSCWGRLFTIDLNSITSIMCIYVCAFFNLYFCHW